MLLGAFEQPFREVERDVSEYLLSIIYAICKEILGKDSLIGAEMVVNNLDLSLDILRVQRGLLHRTRMILLLYKIIGQMNLVNFVSLKIPAY